MYFRLCTIDSIAAVLRRALEPEALRIEAVRVDARNERAEGRFIHRWLAGEEVDAIAAPSVLTHFPQTLLRHPKGRTAVVLHRKLVLPHRAERKDGVRNGRRKHSEPLFETAGR